MGGAGTFYRRLDCPFRLFLLAGLTLEVYMGSYVLPFVVALVAFCILFIGLDFTVMQAQGLSLLFHQ